VKIVGLNIFSLKIVTLKPVGMKLVRLKMKPIKMNADWFQSCVRLDTRQRSSDTHHLVTFTVSC
jgi:hypothetical protein